MIGLQPEVKKPPLIQRLQELYNVGTLPPVLARPVQQPAVQAPRNRKGYDISEIKIPKVTGLAPTFSLVSLLERHQYALDPSAENEVPVRFGGFRKQGRFHPSEVCKDDVCLRALTYELLGAPSQFTAPAKLRRIFDNGHFVHARTQWSLKEALASVGGELYEEVSFKNKIARISGTTDGLFILNGWPYLLEIKSMNKADFKDLGALPWDDHYNQVNIYMHYFGVRAAFILIECKDNQDLREYFVRYDDARWQQTHVVMSAVLQAALEGRLPEQLTKEEGCQGERCKFYQVCKSRAGKGSWAMPSWKDAAEILWEKGRYVQRAAA